MIYYLVALTLVTSTSIGPTVSLEGRTYNWQTVDEYKSMASCERAGKADGLDQRMGDQRLADIAFAARIFAMANRAIRHEHLAPRQNRGTVGRRHVAFGVDDHELG